MSKGKGEGKIQAEGLKNKQTDTISDSGETDRSLSPRGGSRGLTSQPIRE